MELRSSFRTGALYRASTIEELLDYMDCYKGDTRKRALGEIARYNKMCDKGIDENFGKDRRIMKVTVLKDPLFYGVLNKSTSPCLRFFARFWREKAQTWASPAMEQLDDITKPKKTASGRGVRAFNPLSREDIQLFKAMMAGQHHIRGLCNADMRTCLKGSPHLRDLADNPKKQSAKVSRILSRFHEIAP